MIAWGLNATLSFTGGIYLNSLDNNIDFICLHKFDIAAIYLRM